MKQLKDILKKQVLIILMGENKMICIFDNILMIPHKTWYGYEWVCPICNWRYEGKVKIK
jgi:hypothetical protein